MKIDVGGWSRGHFLTMTIAIFVTSFLLRHLAGAPQITAPLRMLAAVLYLVMLVFGVIVVVRWLRAARDS